MLQLLLTDWKLPAPKLIIDVTGSATELRGSRTQQNRLKYGLIHAAKGFSSGAVLFESHLERRARRDARRVLPRRCVDHDERDVRWRGEAGRQGGARPPHGGPPERAFTHSAAGRHALGTSQRRGKPRGALSSPSQSRAQRGRASLLPVNSPQSNSRARIVCIKRLDRTVCFACRR